MRNLFMTICYEGTNYSGFQTQPHGNTIQDVLEAAIFRLTSEKVKVNGSGRTDAGVHARGQVINFLTNSNIPVENWWKALNAQLPDDIRILNVKEVPLKFHARFHARSKTYRYSILVQRNSDIFHRHFLYHHPKPLDVGDMELALQHFIGEHDFTTFCSAKSMKEDHVRTIYVASLEKERSWYGDGEILHFYIKGNGFLYNMVRIMIGTLIEVGQGKRDHEQIPSLLEAKNRKLAGPTAESKGLMLWEVEYDPSMVTIEKKFE